MKVYIDMDGVLTDFHGAMEKFFNIKPGEIVYELGNWDTCDKAAKYLGLSGNQFWGDFTIDFWSGMGWTIDGKMILETLINSFGEENCIIMSSPANAISAHGKIEWLQRCLPKFYKDGRFALARAKHMFAHPDALLIDDGDHNHYKFIAHKGQSILYPRYWNKNHPLRDASLNYLKYCLTKYAQCA